MACDRLSAEMATEEGDDNAQVKEDHDVETDVVEGADSLLVDEAGPCGSNEAGMLLSILRDMFEDKPSRKQTEKQRKTSRSRRERRQKPLLEKKNAEEKRRKWLKEPSTKENMNAPMNHMIDVTVASYWECACQRPLTSGSLGALSC